MSLALLNLKLSAKNCWWPRWPQTTLAGSLVNTWPWVIINGLRIMIMILKELHITEALGRISIFPPLTHNGKVRILTWPQVIDISKIRDIQIVGTSGLIKFWKFEKILLRTVAVARAYTFLEVRSRDSTWWPDLMWPRHKNFTTDVKLINEKVCQVWLCCSFSFSSYSRKTTGGAKMTPPPPGRRLSLSTFGGQTGHFRPLGGHGPVPPLIRLCWLVSFLCHTAPSAPTYHFQGGSSLEHVTRGTCLIFLGFSIWWYSMAHFSVHSILENVQNLT